MQRLDTLLVERDLAETRGRAQGIILAGHVKVGGRVTVKAGTMVAPDAEVTVFQDHEQFVSRAGEKLAAALEVFNIEVADRDCMDAGASTGGFTDVLLKAGARRVLSVDVGYGQLDWRLRNEPRVTVMERTNVRYLHGGDLPFQPDLLVADLSFISLKVALESLLRSSESVKEAVLLVKPQFEAGPEHVSRGGVVRDAEIHARVIESVVRSFEALGFGAVEVIQSPVTGRKAGNREYPLHLIRETLPSLGDARIREVVNL